IKNIQRLSEHVILKGEPIQEPVVKTPEEIAEEKKKEAEQAERQKEAEKKEVEYAAREKANQEALDTAEWDYLEKQEEFNNVLSEKDVYLDFDEIAANIDKTEPAKPDEPKLTIDAAAWRWY